MFISSIFSSMEIFKRYIVSSLVTFAAGFAIAVVPQIDQISIASFQDGAVIGILFAGARLGIKMVLEAFLAWYSTKQ